MGLLTGDDWMGAKARDGVRRAVRASSRREVERLFMVTLVGLQCSEEKREKEQGGEPRIAEGLRRHGG